MKNEELKERFLYYLISQLSVSRLFRSLTRILYSKGHCIRDIYIYMKMMIHTTHGIEIEMERLWLLVCWRNNMMMRRRLEFISNLSIINMELKMKMKHSKKIPSRKNIVDWWLEDLFHLYSISSYTMQHIFTHLPFYSFLSIKRLFWQIHHRVA